MLDRLKSLIQEELQNQHTVHGAGIAEQQVIVARQPVFDQKGGIWGYELLYRRPPDLAAADFSSGTVATAAVIINGFDSVRPSLKKSQKVLINFNSELIETQVIRLLPAETCIVEVLEDVEPTPAVIESIKAIKAAGYIVALDDYTGQASLQPFLPLVDIIKVEVLGRSPRELANLLLRLRGDRIKATLLAEKVENAPTAALCRELGFTLFQGYFFSKPELMHGKKVSTSQAVRMHILALCIGDEVDIRAIGDAVMHDPIITARFLRFVNSAHFGLRRNIQSVHRALALVGPITFMRWLCVNVLATLENTLVAHELAFLASQRAKFLENLGSGLKARNMLKQDISVSALFLTGLFSLLESVMRMPLAEALEGVPVNEDVLTALEGGESAYSPWLKLLDRYEHGEWETSIAIARTLNLAEKDLSSAYTQALEWSSIFFQSPVVRTNSL